ncbi:hypothetical protein Tco_0259833 [Tanacetum coccineum]
MPPRSGLTWKPMGRIFTLVGLKWIPIRKPVETRYNMNDSALPLGKETHNPKTVICENSSSLSVGTSMASEPISSKGSSNERISKKRTKNEAKTTKPDTEWKSMEKTQLRDEAAFFQVDILSVRVDNVVLPYRRLSFDILLPLIRFPYQGMTAPIYIPMLGVAKRTIFVLIEEAVNKKGGSTVSTVRPKRVSTAGVTINTADYDISVVEPRTPPTTTSIFDDEDVTMAQTLIKMKEEKAKEKGVAFKDVEDFSRHARSILTLKPLPIIDPKDKGKGVLQEPKPAKKMAKSNFDAAQIARDAEIARQLEVDWQAEEERKR